MKILNVKVKNFKAMKDNYEISFLTRGNKTEYHKEYELSEIMPNLYTFNTLGIIGKNASGKTMALDMLYVVYEIFARYQIINTKSILKYNNKPISIDVVFCDEEYAYKYMTDIVPSMIEIDSTFTFEKERVYRKKYLKSYSNDIMFFDEDDLYISEKKLPNTFSILAEIIPSKGLYGMYFGSEEPIEDSYNDILNLFERLDEKGELLKSVIKIFDEHIENLEVKSTDKYVITFSNGKHKDITGSELSDYLSSGTSKGIGLFALIIYSLINGTDLMIDEIENHFHKNIVNYIISLYKEKRINKKCARLIFTTHYCELLDTFNRTDNIYISKYDDKIYLENWFDDYNIRTELLKSKKFYNNTFKTNVSYDALMNLKKGLIKYDSER